MTDGRFETAARGRSWRTSDLAIDGGRQRVERAGETIELPRLSYELLVVLIEAAPDIVTLNELMSRVWKDLVVTPETLTQRVKLLRDALGDDAREPRYIEGLRGRGYRWMPEVVPADHADAIPTADPESPSSARVLRGRHAWIVGALLAISLAAFAPWALRGMLTRADDPGSAPDSFVARTAAVLSFHSGERDELGDGVADSIAAQLAEVRGLTIISRYSTQAADSPSSSLREIGHRLGARYLISGSVRREGAALRVTAAISDSESGQQVWTRQYTREAGDFFGLQDEVAQGVAHALRSRIAGLDPALPPTDRSGNWEAWLAYLRGRTLLGRSTIVGAVAASRQFERAMALDPGFVPAVVGLYDARMQEAALRYSDMNAARAAHADLLARARRLQPDSGAVQLIEAMWSGAPPEARIAAFEAGLARDPGNARAMTAYSELLDQLGRREDAARWLERAIRVDPLWPRAHFRRAQRNFAVVGSAVEQQTLRLLELDPQYYPALQRLAKYQWMNHGETALAISIIDKAIASDPENPWGLHTAAVLYLDIGEPETADKLVRGNAVADASTRALRALYRGDWQSAGIAAYEPSSRIFGKPERWGVPAAIRDHGLRSGELDRAVTFLSREYDLPREGPWALSTDNFREAQLLAHLLLVSGARTAAISRLDEVIAWIDANAFYGPVYNLRTKAQALMLKGDTDAALVELARSFEEHDVTLWWYTLQFDPTWEPVRADPRFLAIADSVRSAARAQRIRLGQLRVQGDVP